MKRIVFLFLITMLINSLTVLAQVEYPDTTEAQEVTDVIQDAIDACIAMRDAAVVGDSAVLMQSAQELRANNVANFNSLRCKDDSVGSLNGHLVFDEAFADSLANGRDIYRHADDMNRSAAHRGQTTNGNILTKTCFVKAGKSTKYTFASKGHQELAVVAESGGLVTMKIHVTNNNGLDKRYDDTRDVKKGRPQRKTAFDLPDNRRNTVELEVINCSNRDISFVVISN